MTNLNMSSISNSQYKTVNTDGTDTWNSKDVTISNWTVTCGDVSTKLSRPLLYPAFRLIKGAGLHIRQGQQHKYTR